MKRLITVLLLLLLFVCVQKVYAKPLDQGEDLYCVTLPRHVSINRGGEIRKTTFNVTAYTLREEECGKSEDHPLYGITASGDYVTEWQTIAAPPSIPFDTVVYIPYFSDKPNKGWFIVEDRGGAITEGHLDIYMVNYEDANEFGRQDLDVYIVGGKTDD